ncbi:hypothetical protein K8I61_17565 [bacterium]|nr:hypothetical protein [bacterium]
MTVDAGRRRPAARRIQNGHRRFPAFLKRPDLPDGFRDLVLRKRPVNQKGVRDDPAEMIGQWKGTLK